MFENLKVLLKLVKNQGGRKFDEYFNIKKVDEYFNIKKVKKKKKIEV